MNCLENHPFTQSFPLLQEISLYLDPEKNEVTKMFFAIFRSEERSITDRSQSTLLTEYKKQQNRFSRDHDNMFRILLLEEVSIFYKKIFNHPIPQEINTLCNNKTTQLEQLVLKIKKILGTSFIKRADPLIGTLSFDTCPLSFLQGGKKLLAHISKIQKSETNKSIFFALTDLYNLHHSLSLESTSSILLDLGFYQFYKNNKVDLLLSVFEILRNSYKHMRILEKILKGLAISYGDLTLAIDSAAKAGHFTAVAFLLENRPISNEDRAVSIAKALQGNHFTIIELLLENGPILEEHRGMAVEKAAKSGCFAILELLLENGPISEEHRGMAVEEAAKNGHLSTVQRLLTKGPISDECRKSSIKNAIEKGHMPVIKYLFENVTIADEVLESSLEKAAEAGHLETIEWIFETIPIPNEARGWAMIRAAKSGHLDVFKFLLNETIPNEYLGWAIGKAAENGRLSLIYFLLDNRMICDKYRALAIREAALAGHFNIVNLLNNV